MLPSGAARTSAAYGVYTEVVPNEKLQFTWKPSWNPREESLVTVTFCDAPADCLTLDLEARRITCGVHRDTAVYDERHASRNRKWIEKKRVVGGINTQAQLDSLPG